MYCPYCHSTASVKDGLDQHTCEQRYQCKTCGRKFKETSKGRAEPVRSEHTVINCLNCGEETTNPKFCSSSCAATYTNKAYPKRKAKPRNCKYCGSRLTGKRQTVCEECNHNKVDWMERTLGDIHRTAKYQVSAHLRTIARDLYHKSRLSHACANCGYDKHVEICHIKAINSFSDDTPVAVINDVSNLVALCPNCHWEFDHGLLIL